MAVGRIENTIYAPHRITPDRAIVPHPKPFDAPVGTAPFHRVLESENLANIANQINSINRPSDHYESSSTSSASNTKPQLCPKLGEVLPIKVDPVIETKVQTTTQVQLPATGRLIDVYI